jgi:intraflagellar transport protein 74
MNENNDLMTEYSRKQNQMEDLLSKLANSENKLKMDSQKLKGQLLKEQITDLEAKKSDY